MVAEQCCARLMGVGDRRTVGSSEEADISDEDAGGLVGVPEMFLEVAIRLREVGSLVQDLAEKIDEKFIDKIVDVSVVSQREVPAIQQVKKVAEDEPVWGRQVPMIQKVLKTVEGPQVQYTGCVCRDAT